MSIWYCSTTCLQVIPQGTVDNNLGPDRLTDPKALDPKYCRQLNPSPPKRRGNALTITLHRRGLKQLASLTFYPPRDIQS